MVCLDKEWKEKGKKGGAGWEEVGIVHAVLPAGCCVLSSSFRRDAVDKVVSFAPIEAKQECPPFQDLYKYKILYILYVNYVFCMYFTSQAVAFLLTRSKLRR